MRNAEEKTVKTLCFKRLFASYIIVFVTLLVASQMSHAFVGSEEEMMQAEINEALARARDFEKHKRREAQADERRLKAASEIKEKRARERERQEQAREAYLAKRPEREAAAREKERLEKAYELKLEKQAKQRELARQEYVKKRNRMQSIIEKEAYIDPAEEYGL